jgi:hypothetical protein
MRTASYRKAEEEVGETEEEILVSLTSLNVEGEILQCAPHARFLVLELLRREAHRPSGVPEFTDLAMVLFFLSKPRVAPLVNLYSLATGYLFTVDWLACTR